jgi:hypothetical protein
MAVNGAEELSAIVSRSLQAEYESVRVKVHGLVQGLSTDQLWQRPYSYVNSVGHLLLHLTGNLSYYIGAQIAGSGYVRNRPWSFRTRRGGPRTTCCAPSMKRSPWW